MSDRIDPQSIESFRLRETGVFEMITAGGEIFTAPPASAMADAPEPKPFVSAERLVEVFGPCVDEPICPGLLYTLRRSLPGEQHQNRLRFQRMPSCRKN
jgi:hypothetical protein